MEVWKRLTIMVTPLERIILNCFCGWGTARRGSIYSPMSNHFCYSKKDDLFCHADWHMERLIVKRKQKAFPVNRFNNKKRLNEKVLNVINLCGYKFIQGATRDSICAQNPTLSDERCRSEKGRSTRGGKAHGFHARMCREPGSQLFEAAIR